MANSARPKMPIMPNGNLRIVKKLVVSLRTGESYPLSGFQTYQGNAPTFIVELNSADGRHVRAIAGRPGEYELVDDLGNNNEPIAVL